MRHDLDRFVQAQDRDATHDRALAELRRGRKTTHWMWFVFPQLTALGRSATAKHYGISGLDEARAYLTHPVLAPRLLSCSRALLELDGSAHAVLGSPDDLKLRSSMTLFLRADPGSTVFSLVLDRFYGGELDPATEALLGGPPGTCLGAPARR